MEWACRQVAGLSQGLKTPRSGATGAAIATEKKPLLIGHCALRAILCFNREDCFDTALLSMGNAALRETSIPSANFTPWISFGNWLWPSIRRQLFWVPSTSLRRYARRMIRARTMPSATLNGVVPVAAAQRKTSRVMAPMRATEASTASGRSSMVSWWKSMTPPAFAR